MNSAKTVDKPDRRVAIAFAGVVSGSIAVAITTASVITSNSVALMADMIGTIFEFMAVFFAWLTLRKLAKKGGNLFDYGYGKLENMVSVIIAALMFLSLSIVVFNAVRRFASPEPISGFGVWLMVFAHIVFLGINGRLCLQTKQSMRKQPSPILTSQFRLFAVKAFTNVCMAVTIALSLTFREVRAAMYIDPVMSLVISASMFFGAYRIITNNLGALLDQTLEEEAQLRIMKILSESFDEYVQLHGVRSRRSGDRVFVEIFLEFDGDRSMSDVLSVIDDITAKTEDAIPNSDVSVVPTTRSRI